MSDSPTTDGHGVAMRRRVTFDPTINLGHVLTFIGVMVAGLSAYSGLDKRVTLIESQAAVISERSREQDMRIKETLGDIRSDVKDLQRTVNDVNRTVNASTPRGNP